MTGTAALYDIPLRTIDGEETTLAPYRGSVLLIVNVASKCGFTPQYRDLENFYQRYKHQGFAVLGFPCNQFASQEPGDEAEIKSFCSLTYNVTFPMFSKINVNGNDTHPLYRYLKQQQPGMLGLGLIKWNFTKFLVGREGSVTHRFGPLSGNPVIAPCIELELKDGAIAKRAAL